MKKLVKRLVTLFGPIGTCAVGLAGVAVALLFARGLVGHMSDLLTPEIVESSGGDAVVKKIEAKFQYKPLIICDGGILVVPSKEEGGDVWPDGSISPPRKRGRLVSQYRGYAEYVVDLEISSDNVKTNEFGEILSVQLKRPRCPYDSIRWVDAADTNRLFIIDGTDSEWKSFYERHLPQLITARIRSNADTLQNREEAERQTRRMVSAMIGDLAADPVKGVEIDWIDN